MLINLVHVIQHRIRMKSRKILRLQMILKVFGRICIILTVSKLKRSMHSLRLGSPWKNLA